MIPNYLSNKGPLFKDKIYVTRPNLPSLSELSPKIEEMLKRQWVTNFGEFHNELESRLKARLKVKNVILCCNGSIGLFLLLKALELKGSVLTTPFTFPATIHAISMAGMRPIFCDIDEDAYTILPEEIEKKIKPDTSAILAVNVFGNVSDIEELDRIGASHNMPVIYDSAHAFLCSYKERPVGNFGKAEMFSFHATKLFTTLEGGAITTNDDVLARKLKLLINFGIKDEEHVTDIGLNGKMTELNAIFGLLGLDKIDDIIKRLKSLAGIYRRRLGSVPGIKFQKVREGCVINHQYMAVEIDEEKFGVGRNVLYEILKKDNVFVRKYFFPAGYDYKCYKDKPFAKGIKLHNTQKVSDGILCLPMYYSLKNEEIEKICDLMVSVHQNHKKIAEQRSMR